MATTTRLATFHHLIKTHKSGPQLKIRPIVASRGSPTERIAWLLSKILRPLLKDVPLHMPSSEALMKAVSDLSTDTLSRYRYQCSLDVVALYTTVPIGEALAAVRAKLSLNSSAVPHPLQIGDVMQLLKTVFALTYLSLIHI